MKRIGPALDLYSEAIIANSSERYNRTSPQTFARKGLSMFLLATAVWLISLEKNEAQAQPSSFFRSLYSFTNGVDGESPSGPVILCGGTLYGTAGFGTNGNGTVFAINTDGTAFRVLHTFGELFSSGFQRTNLDGAEPYGGLLLSSNKLYGTTLEGGMQGFGTVYAINTNGTAFSTVHNFTETDGGYSYAGLIISGNTLYGTSQLGSPRYDGNVFAVNTDGPGFSSLYSFTGYGDGSFPYAALVLGGNTLYGTTVQGGSLTAADYELGGTVFAVNTDGTGFTVLHSFANSNSPDGRNPYGGLILSGNKLYGTAGGGGTTGYGTVFGVNTDGTGFTEIHTFNGVEGSDPAASMVLSGNTLYGTTVGGGASGNGTVFAVNTDDTGFTVLHSFEGSDGAVPWIGCGLVLSGKALYGTTAYGGSNNAGTLFVITLPSAPAITPNSMSVTNGQLQFVVLGLTPGATVYVQASSDPSSTAHWFPVATNVTTATNLTISGLSVTNAHSRFFRVLETLPP